MRRGLRLPLVLLMLLGPLAAVGQTKERDLLSVACEPGADLEALRRRVATFSGDGRVSLVDLYRFQCALERAGWRRTEAFVERYERGAERLRLPSNLFATAKKGPALWILTGVHGEEPAGPNALAQSGPVIEALAAQGIPVVVAPLLNPLGYQRGWRYPDTATYSEQHPGSSVGDSDHLLPDAHGRPRRPDPACRQADLLTARVLALASEYPPLVTLDLHEDNLLARGYVYSQGARGADDPVAAKIVGDLRRRGFPLLENGTTRFGEAVRGGIVSAVQDGSIDELLSAPAVITKGVSRPGPAARTVLVLETSAKDAALPDRLRVHLGVLSSLQTLWREALQSR